MYIIYIHTERMHIGKMYIDHTLFYIIKNMLIESLQVLFQFV